MSLDKCSDTQTSTYPVTCQSMVFYIGRIWCYNLHREKESFYYGNLSLQGTFLCVLRLACVCKYFQDWLNADTQHRTALSYLTKVVLFYQHPLVVIIVLAYFTSITDEIIDMICMSGDATNCINYNSREKAWFTLAIFIPSKKCCKQVRKSDQ